MHVTSERRSCPESRFDDYAVRTLDELVAIVGEPKPAIATKETAYLTPLLMEFLQSSPFYLLATSNANGSCDVSPKGDPAGAIHILDARTIVLPDRLGNKRVDSLKNLLTNPHVGLLFLIPAVDETVRVNGRATISRDPELLEKFSVQGKLPNLVLVIEIDEVFTHCARSILRSQLWQPESWPDPATIPTMVAINAEQKNLPPPDESEGKRNEEYRTRLY